MSKTIATTLLAGLILMGVTGSAMAAAADPPSPVFASVDPAKVQAGYTKRPELERQLQALSGKLSAAFKTQTGSYMLSLADQKTLASLLVGATPTDAQKAQITALQNKSAADAAELAALQQKQNPTDADKTRLNDLTAEQQHGGEALQQIQDDYNQQMQAEQDRLGEVLTQAIRAAISEVAKQKGITVVLDAHVALYCSNDITNDVIAKINK